MVLLQRLPCSWQQALSQIYCEHMDATWLVTMLSPALDLGPIDSSNALILHAICHLPSHAAHYKALSTCSYHASVITLFTYLPSPSLLTILAATGCPAISTSYCLNFMWWCSLHLILWSVECRPSHFLRRSGPCLGSLGRGSENVGSEWASHGNE